MRTSAIPLMLFITLCGPGCGYPELSPPTYELSQALYAACNRKSEEQLSRVEKLIESKSRSGEIPEEETEILTSIAEQARDGEWESAMTEARRLMEDQVEW